MDIISKALATRTKTDKWNYIRVKSFHTVKETINRVKGRPTEWEKVFVNRISDELLPKIYNDLIQLNNKKVDNKI